MLDSWLAPDRHGAGQSDHDGRSSIQYQFVAHRVVKIAELLMMICAEHSVTTFQVDKKK